MFGRETNRLQPAWNLASAQTLIQPPVFLAGSLSRNSLTNQHVVDASALYYPAGCAFVSRTEQSEQIDCTGLIAQARCRNNPVSGPIKQLRAKVSHSRNHEGAVDRSSFALLDAPLR